MPALGAGFSDPTGKSFLFGTADFRRSTTLLTVAIATCSLLFMPLLPRQTALTLRRPE